MKCLVCDAEFTGSFCPYCGFPVYELIGDDLDESADQIMKLARNHRQAYLKDVEVGVVAYKWKDENGRIVEDSHVVRYIADGISLLRGDSWLAEPFARIPDEKTITIKTVIRRASRETVVNVAIPNLPEAELQQIGVRLEDGLKIRMLLRNESGASESRPVSLTGG